MGDQAPPTGVMRGAAPARPDTPTRATQLVAELRVLLREELEPIRQEVAGLAAWRAEVESREREQAARRQALTEALGLPHDAPDHAVDSAVARARGAGTIGRLLADRKIRVALGAILAYALAYLAAQLGVPLPAAEGGAPVPTTPAPSAEGGP